MSYNKVKQKVPIIQGKCTEQGSRGLNSATNFPLFLGLLLHLYAYTHT